MVNIWQHTSVVKFKVEVLWLHLPAETRKCNPNFNQGSPADNRVRNLSNREHSKNSLLVLQSPVLAAVQDILVLLPQWVVMAVIVAVHCALIFSYDVPGCPR